MLQHCISDVRSNELSNIGPLFSCMKASKDNDESFEHDPVFNGKPVKRDKYRVMWSYLDLRNMIMTCCGVLDPLQWCNCIFGYIR